MQSALTESPVASWTKERIGSRLAASDFSSRCTCAHANVFDEGLLRAGTAAGVAAGIAVVGVLTSQTKERMEKAGVSLTIKDYSELVAKAKADEAKQSNGKI